MKGGIPMPLINLNNCWIFSPLNWNIFFQKIVINHLISDSLKKNIINSDKMVALEFNKELNDNLNYFYCSLPFYLLDSSITYIDVRFHINNIQSYVNIMQLNSESFDIRDVPDNPELILKENYDDTPIICWKGANSTIILDGYHRIQFAKNNNKSFIKAHIIQKIDRSFFCDSLSYWLFNLWFIQQQWRINN